MLLGATISDVLHLCNPSIPRYSYDIINHPIIVFFFEFFVFVARGEILLAFVSVSEKTLVKLHRHQSDVYS